MIRFFAALVFSLFVSIASAQDGAGGDDVIADPTQPTPASYCAAYSRMVVYGATQAMRGATSEFAYITTAEMMRMIAEGADGSDKLYILLDEEIDRESRRAIETAILDGYLAMLMWLTVPENADRTPPNNKAIWEQSYAICMDRLGVKYK